MEVILIVGGIVSLIYGVFNVLGKTENDISKDSSIDKKLFSEKTRYFIGRYYAGLQFIAAGLGAIVLGLIIYFSK